MMGNKAIYLTVCEFYFLLIQRELDGLVIFEELTEYETDDRKMAQGFFSLVEKGILTADGEGCYHLSEYMRTVIDILEGAVGTFVIKGYLSSCPVQCLYFSSGLCLTVQMDDFRKDIARIEVQDQKDAVNGLLSYEFMPETDSFGYEAGEEPAPDDMETLMQLINRTDTELLSDESVLMIADWYLRGSAVPDKRVILSSIEERYFVIITAGGEMRAERFDSGMFASLFMEV